MHTPYGATEALPVTSISGREILARRARAEGGEGSPVGWPVSGLDVRLIAIDDAPIPTWSAAREVAPGEAGEICVRGPQVTRAYERDGAATELAKIADETRLLAPHGRRRPLRRRRLPLVPGPQVAPPRDRRAAS